MAAYGEVAYGEVGYGELPITSVTVSAGLATATAAGLITTPQGDSYVAHPHPAYAVADALNPSAASNATIQVLAPAAKAQGFTPTIPVGTLTLPLARAKSTSLLAFWTQIVTTGTGTTNAGEGRSRGGVATIVIDRPTAAVPSTITLGVKVDKAIAYPTPDMVGGRPT